MRSEVIAHGISMCSAKKVRLSSENAPFTRLPGGTPAMHQSLQPVFPRLSLWGPKGGGRAGRGTREQRT